MIEFDCNDNDVAELKRIYHFDDIFITGCTRRCQNDNFSSIACDKNFAKKDNISVSERNGPQHES